MHYLHSSRMPLDFDRLRETVRQFYSRPGC